MRGLGAGGKVGWWAGCVLGLGRETWGCGGGRGLGGWWLWPWSLAWSSGEGEERGGD